MRKKEETAYGVIGLGRFGEALAIMLAQSGKEVIVVDRDESKIKEMRQYVSGSQIPDAGINAPEPAPQNTGYMQGGIRIQHTRQLRPRMPCGTLGKVKHPERLPFLPRKRMLLRQRPQHGIDGKSRNAQPWNFGLDIKILFKTVIMVLKNIAWFGE